MPSTRQRIMEYLEAHHRASAVELSRVLNMTAANVRHHLAELESEGKVESVGELRAKGRGRPTLLYMATRQAQPHSLDVLSSHLLDELGEARPAEQEKRLGDLAARLRANTGDKGGSISVRLGNAVKRLNELRYRARWEAHASGPRVILGQCPYAAIIDQHPELCRMDALMLNGMLGSEVEQTAKLERSPHGPPHCIFLVKQLNQKT